MDVGQYLIQLRRKYRYIERTPATPSGENRFIQQVTGELKYIKDARGKPKRISKKAIKRLTYAIRFNTTIRKKDEQ